MAEIVEWLADELKMVCLCLWSQYMSCDVCQYWWHRARVVVHQRSACWPWTVECRLLTDGCPHVCTVPCLAAETGRQRAQVKHADVLWSVNNLLMSYKSQLFQLSICSIDCLVAYYIQLSVACVALIFFAMKHISLTCLSVCFSVCVSHITGLSFQCF